MASPQRKSVKKKVVPVKTVHIGEVDYKDRNAAQVHL